MTSMYICLHYSLHGYIFITLQVHFYTTIAALVLILDELGNVLSHHKILVVSCLCPVLTHTLGKGGVLLVESSEQGLVFGAYALIGVSHHFSGNSSFPCHCQLKPTTATTT